MPKNLTKDLSSFRNDPKSFSCEIGTGGQAICFRALKAFQDVYMESSYTNACINMRSSRRTVLKLIRDLEGALGSPLFEEEKDGRVLPSPFGERFFNDMRFLESAMERFLDRVESIRRERRVLRVGASVLVFRTLLFRSHFRCLRSFEGFRVLYVEVPSTEAGRNLATGEIDWFFDLQPMEGQRFVSEESGGIPIATYRRIGQNIEISPSIYQVLPEQESPNLLPAKKAILQENQWLRWLDHPAECEAGTEITTPRISADPLFWEELPDEGESTVQFNLHAIRLRQHPYEFLPGLAAKLVALSKHR